MGTILTVGFPVGTVTVVDLLERPAGAGIARARRLERDEDGIAIGLAAVPRGHVRLGRADPLLE